MNFIEKVILKAIKGKVAKWFDMERSLKEISGAKKAALESPIKSWPDPEKIMSGNEVPFSMKNISIVGKYLRSSIDQGMKAITSISKNPAVSKRTISSEELKEIIDKAKSLGIGDVGFCKIPAHLIFQDRAVLYDYAIVLTMEMDLDAILKAPSVDTFKMVMKTYDFLGIATNKLTTKLRKSGFQAHASHPLGGLALYPPLAVEAGLGWCGRHGLLITPTFGARQRISAIFVNIDNLPISQTNEHNWIEDFCNTCGKCIRTCPEKAILNDPIVHESGRKTHLEREKCLPAFVNKQGCTVCVKECVFTKYSYDHIKKRFII